MKYPGRRGQRLADSPATPPSRAAIRCSRTLAAPERDICQAASPYRRWGIPTFPTTASSCRTDWSPTSVNTSTWFGTNAYNALVPALTCDPRKNAATTRQSDMRFNPNCFTTPAYRSAGPTYHALYAERPTTGTAIWASTRTSTSPRASSIQIQGLGDELAQPSARAVWTGRQQRSYELRSTSMLPAR